MLHQCGLETHRTATFPREELREFFLRELQEYPQGRGRARIDPVRPAGRRNSQQTIFSLRLYGSQGAAREAVDSVEDGRSAVWWRKLPAENLLLGLFCWMMSWSELDAGGEIICSIIWKTAGWFL